MNKSGLFVVLFQGRSGSSFLLDALDSHPEIEARGEILERPANEERAYMNSAAYRLKRAVKEVLYGSLASRQKREFMHFCNIYCDNCRAMGFKTKVIDMSDKQEMKRLFELYDAKIIVLKRDNIVKQSISHINAARLFREKNRYNLMGDERSAGSLYIDPKLFDNQLQKAAFALAELMNFSDYLNLPRLVIDYAELLQNQDEVFNNTLDYLEVSRSLLKSSYRKNTSDDLRECVENFEELKNIYRNTMYGDMFDQ